MLMTKMLKVIWLIRNKFFEGAIVMHKADLDRSEPLFVVIGVHWDGMIICECMVDNSVQYFPYDDLILKGVDCL